WQTATLWPIYLAIFLRSPENPRRASSFHPAFQLHQRSAQKQSPPSRQSLLDTCFHGSAGSQCSAGRRNDRTFPPITSSTSANLFALDRLRDLQNRQNSASQQSVPPWYYPKPLLVCNHPGSRVRTRTCETVSTHFPH